MGVVPVSDACPKPAGVGVPMAAPCPTTMAATGMFATHQFYRNYVGVSQESVQTLEQEKNLMFQTGPNRGASIQMCSNTTISFKLQEHKRETTVVLGLCPCTFIL